MNGPADLAAVFADHEALDAEVRAAREAAAGADEVAASGHVRAAWERFAPHRDHEEARWLPRYAAHAPATPNAAVEVFLRDHAHLEALFAEALAREGLERVDVLDDLAGALEHHDLRERRYLLPTLQQQLSETERAALLAAYPRDMAASAPRPPRSTAAVWHPTPSSPVDAARRAILGGAPPAPLADALLPPPPFRAKAARVNRSLARAEPVAALATLRRIAWLHTAAARVARLHSR